MDEEQKSSSNVDFFLRLFLLIQRIIDRITWFILFSYILEMRDVKLKLESASFEAYKISLKNQKRLEILNVLVLVVASLPIAVLGYFNDENNKDLNLSINRVYMILRPITFAFTLMMFIFFVQLVKFF